MNPNPLRASLPWAVLLLVGCTAFAGELDPPGPPAPTMKTLGEVEPRVDLSTLPASSGAVHEISTAGSYYLTENLTGVSGLSGIEISASNVTLDLNGFALVGVAGSLDGVVVTGDRQYSVVVKNGTISGWGESAIDAEQASDSIIQGITATQNGDVAPVFDGAIRLGSGLIKECIASNNRGLGISIGQNGQINGAVVDSVARGNTTHGFSGRNSIISNCVSERNGNFYAGFSIDGKSTLVDSKSIGNYKGVEVFGGSALRNSIIDSTTGIRVASSVGGFIEQNHVAQAATGILVDDGAANSRVEGNSIAGATVGIETRASSSGNLLLRNSVAGAATPYVLAGGNTFGPVVDLTSGGEITEMNPWANLSH